MSYIMLVNPQILRHTGIPASDVVVATSIASGIGSLVCGIFGNLPLGLAPGMGLSAYITFGLVVSGYLTRQQAFTSCLIAGIAQFVVGLLGWSNAMMAVIPRPVKLATIVGMAMLISLIGMVSVGLVTSSNETVVTLGDVFSKDIIITLSGVALISSMLLHNVRGSILIGIVILAFVCWYVDDSWPSSVLDYPKIEYGPAKNIDFSSVDETCIGAILAFMIVGIFDVSGAVFGMSQMAGITQADGTTPGSLYAFLGASIGTVIAAVAGCSPIIVHVESAAGIKDGGRTGLTSVTVGVCFLLSIFFAPVFGNMPAAATSPVLILVGAFMMGEGRHIDWTNLRESIPGFMTAVMMPFTFSIPNGIMFGMGSSLVLYIASGDLFTDIGKFFNSSPDKVAPETREGDKGGYQKGNSSVKDSDSLVANNHKDM